MTSCRTAITADTVVVALLPPREERAAAFVSVGCLSQALA